MKEILKKYELSPNQYLYLKYLITGSELFDIHPDEIKDLIARNYIAIENDRIKITESSKRIFDVIEEANELFLQIWNSYPKKTPNGRLLRSLSMNSQIALKAFRNIKSSLVTQKDTDVIINALKNELNIRLKNNSLNYMLHINTWINRKEWESYIDENATDEDESVFDIG